MTTPQQIASKCAFELDKAGFNAPDLETEKQLENLILSTIPLHELLEVARAAQNLAAGFSYPSIHPELRQRQIKMDETLQSLQQKGIEL